jgi:glucose-6-phosphate 1-dehydrogenase
MSEIGRLLLFGATGDLPGRFLFPALAALERAGELPPGITVTGVAVDDLDDERFRRHVAKRLEEHGSGLPGDARQRILEGLSYRQVDLGASDQVIAAAEEAAETGALVAYLALPPALFGGALEALGEAELPAGSRVAIEKPFGTDLESAIELNRRLEQVMGAAGEEAVFRVDHLLGMATVDNMLALRVANGLLEGVWSGAHIERIEVLWEETLALEGRAGYYDRTGALKDVVQNHALQLLSLVAMDPPVSLAERDLRDAKVRVLASVRPLDGSQTRRARYAAGRVDGREIPAYADEAGVDPSRETETFAELSLELDADRWAGTRFVLRAGKAMRRRRKGVLVQFREAANFPFQDGAGSNELWIGIDEPNTVRFELAGASAGRPPRLVPLGFEVPAPESDLSPYARVLQAVLDGDGALSVRGDEAEQAWRLVTPVLEAWGGDEVPLEEYPAGSDGPR